MAVSKALLRKMAAEVSVETLGGLLADYGGRIAEREEVTADTIEDVAAIELIVAEIKSRGGSGTKPERQRQRRSKTKTAEVVAAVAEPSVNVIGNSGGASHGGPTIRTESGQF